ncbi:MAG: TlpA family protein disulfide reductase [Cytophagales bacterium]|nr:MAG: TlpA family protein disulfide reductase [Cytophagales bacterium]
MFSDVWASWCKPCLEEMGATLKLANRFANRNVTFILISIDKDSAKWEAMIEKNKLVMNNIAHYNLDAESKLATFITDGAVPKYMVVAPNGSTITEVAPRPSSDAATALLLELLKSDK